MTAFVMSLSPAGGFLTCVPLAGTGPRGLDLVGVVLAAILAAAAAQHHIERHVAVGRRGDAHIGRLQRDQHRVEVLRSPVPAILHDRQDLVDQQLLAADLDIGVLAQRGQHVGAIAAGGQLVQLRLRERHLQDAGPQGRRGQRRRQGEADRQVGVGRVGGAGRAIGRAEQHALAAGGVAERGHRHRRGKQAGRRIVDRELEAVVQAVVRHRDQLAQDFLARVAVQAVVVRQAHQAPAVHRRLQQGPRSRRRARKPRPGSAHRLRAGCSGRSRRRPA